MSGMADVTRQVLRSELAEIDFIELDDFVMPMGSPRQVEVALSLLGVEVVEDDQRVAGTE